MDHDTPPLPSDLRPPDADAARTYERIWTALHRTDDARASSYDVDAEWTQLADRLNLEEDDSPAPEGPTTDRPPRQPKRGTAPRVRRHTGALTAAFLVVCTLAMGAWWWQQPVSVTTAAGQQTTVTLPDGSTAELNGATTLAYPRGFQSLPFVSASQRRVQLDGEAFFAVESRDRPFRVVTPNARVEVLGTEFDVRTHAAADAPTTTVTLKSGHVRLRSTSGAGPAPATEVTLSEAGHTSRVVGTQAPTSPQTVDLKYVQAWRDGGFAIQNAALPTVLQELERRFGTPLALNVSASTTDPMTLHYAADVRLKDVLRDICVIQGLSFRETSRGYELVRD